MEPERQRDHIHNCPPDRNCLFNLSLWNVWCHIFKRLGVSHHLIIMVQQTKTRCVVEWSGWDVSMWWHYLIMNTSRISYTYGKNSAPHVPNILSGLIKCQLHWLPCWMAALYNGALSLCTYNWIMSIKKICTYQSYLQQRLPAFKMLQTANHSSFLMCKITQPF